MKIINEILQYRQKQLASGKTPTEIPLTEEQKSRLRQWNEQSKSLAFDANGKTVERRPIDLSAGIVFGMKIVPS